MRAAIIITKRFIKHIRFDIRFHSNATTSKHDMIANHYDVVVIGLGGVGSFTLRSLAHDPLARGGTFLGIERSSLVTEATMNDHNSTNSAENKSYQTGSSNGRSRIYRRAYFEHEHYVPWIDYSIDIFQQLQKMTKEKLIQQCGTVIMEESSDPNQLPPLIQQSKLSAELHSIPYEYYKNSYELQNRFPQFQYHHNMMGIYEPGGGFLRPERIMNVALQQAREPTNNATIDILDSAIVTNIKYMRKDDNPNNPIEIHVAQQQGQHYVIATDYLLMAAGSWTGQLIPEWKKYLNVVRQIQTWIDVTGSGEAATANDHDNQPQQQDHIFSYHHMPGFVMCNRDYGESPLYGIPCDTDDPTSAKNWLKIGLHKQSGYNSQLNDNPSMNYQQTVTAHEVNEMMQAIAKGINPSAWNHTNNNSRSSSRSTSSSSTIHPEHIVDMQPCLYTMSPDKHYMMGTPAMYRSNIFVITGLSGHGYKCTPALGQIMVDFVLRPTELVSTWNIDFCSTKRFHI